MRIYEALPGPEQVMERMLCLEAPEQRPNAAAKDIQKRLER